MKLDAQHIEVWESNIVDQPGGLANVLDALEDAGIGIESVLALRGFTASIVGTEFVAYVVTDSESDADRVVHAMRQL